MKYNDLLPCPFCGAKPIIGSLGGDRQNWSISCSKCKISCIENDIGETLEDIKKQWNHRQPEYFICLDDQGGKNGTASDMKYHLPQQYLIRTKKLLTNIEVKTLINKIGLTRKSPAFVGSWGPDGDVLPRVLEYENL